MADIDQRYPLSTADGQAIPFEIIRPIGIVKKSFLSASGTSAFDVPANVELLRVQATENCIIQFATSAAAATALVDGVLSSDAFFVNKTQPEWDTITPPIDKKSFSIIGDTTNGILYIQYLEKWSGLSLQSQITRR